VDPVTAALATQLGDVAARNSATYIFDRIRTTKAKKEQQEVIAELGELLSQLVADKDELVRIAQAYKQQVDDRQISEEEIRYIADHLLPQVKRLMEVAGADAQLRQSVEALSPLVSTETLTILQLVGFNVREAIGEPLTQVVRGLIERLGQQSAVARPKGGGRR
jgi:hypothetical protein